MFRGEEARQLIQMSVYGLHNGQIVRWSGWKWIDRPFAMSFAFDGRNGKCFQFKRIKESIPRTSEWSNWIRTETETVRDESWHDLLQPTNGREKHRIKGRRNLFWMLITYISILFVLIIMSSFPIRNQSKQKSEMSIHAIAPPSHNKSRIPVIGNFN